MLSSDRNPLQAGNQSYETILLDVQQHWESLDLPFRFVWLDSWSPALSLPPPPPFHFPALANIELTLPYPPCTVRCALSLL